MKRKRSANLFLSLMLAFSTMMSDVSVYAEDETGSEESAAEEVTETEETPEEELPEDIVTGEEEEELPEVSETPDISEEHEQDNGITEEVQADETQETSENKESTGQSQDDEDPNDDLTEEDPSDPETEEPEDAGPYAVSGDFTYTVAGGEATITAYSGNSSRVTVPSAVDGYTVTGIGDLAFSKKSSITEITLPDTLESIGYSSFSACSGLVYFTIPENVSSIGAYAFSGCAKLRSINIPDKVTSIGKYTFNECNALVTITIPDGVKTIGEYAFYNCNMLSNITLPNQLTSIERYVFCRCTRIPPDLMIPDSVTSIGENAFSRCTRLENITIPAGVESIGDYAFYYCQNLASVSILGEISEIKDYTFGNCENLKSINIPESVTSIGPSAFRECRKLEAIRLPGQLKELSSQAFYNCDSLKEITIPDGVTAIGSGEFYSCDSLKSAVIPESVITIGRTAFWYCNALTDIYYSGTEDDWNRITFGDSCLPDGVAIHYDYGASVLTNGIKYKKSVKGDHEVIVIIGYTGSSDDVVIPGVIEGLPVCAINNRAFTAENITAVEIPDTVTSIGEYAFSFCQDLRSVRLPVELTEIGSYAFAGCPQLETVTFPDQLEMIGDGAFEECTSLSYVVLPDTVSSVGIWAFAMCSDLKAVFIKNTSITLSPHSFYSDDSLQDIYFAGTEQEWKKITEKTNSLGTDNAVIHYESSVLPDGIIYTKNSQINPPNISIAGYIGGSEAVVIPEKIEGLDVWKINEAVFRDNNSIRSVSLPGVLGQIHKNAFNGCTNLEKIDLPDQLEILEEGAFESCTSLRSIRVPGTVRVIGAGAFRGDSALGSAEIEEGVQDIGSGAFDGCTGLNDLDLPLTISGFGAAAFRGCPFERIFVSERIIEIPAYTFANCMNLKTITVPKSVTVIGEDAFINCTSLRTVVLPEVVFSKDQFKGCDSLEKIKYCGSETRLKKVKGIQYNLIEDRYYLNIDTANGERKVTVELIDTYGDDQMDDRFKIGRDNWKFEHGNYKGAGFKGVNDYSLLEEHYNDLIQYLNRSEVAKLQNAMYPENGWGGSCYGLSMIMALLGNKMLSLSDIPHGTGKPDLYHLDKLPSKNEELRSYIEYYHLSQGFTSTALLWCADYNENTAGMTDSTRSVFTNLFTLMDQGYMVPFCFKWRSVDEDGKIIYPGHAILAVSYEEVTRSKIEELKRTGFVSEQIIDLLFGEGKGYRVKLYNVNAVNGFQYMYVNEDLGKFILKTGETVLSDISEADSPVVMIGYADPRGAVIFGTHKYTQHELIKKTIIFLDTASVRLVSSTGKTLEYVNGVLSGTMSWSDLRYGTDGSQELSICVDDAGDWTVTSLSGGEIAMSVYDNDRFMQVSASNADQVDLSLSSGTMNITGTNVAFDVHMTTDEDVLPGQAGHGAIAGEGSGTISFSTTGSSVAAASTGEMNNVVSTAYIGNGYGRSEEQDHVTNVTADTKGYQVGS